MNLTITTNDLFEINNAAKALKQRNIVWINNLLIGLDDKSYEVMIHLNTDKMNLIPFRCIAFNQRQLSAFVNTITTESQFIINNIGRIIISQLLKNRTNELLVNINNQLDKDTMESMIKMNAINGAIVENNILEENVTEYLNGMLTDAKDIGVFKITKDHNHLMYIPTKVLSLAKNDKIYMSIVDITPNNPTFIVRFRIRRKTYEICYYFNIIRLGSITPQSYGPYISYNA